jgi:hypothetical protein
LEDDLTIFDELYLALVLRLHISTHNSNASSLSHGALAQSASTVMICVHLYGGDIFIAEILEED